MIEEKVQKIQHILNEAICGLENKLGKDIFDFNDFYFAGGCIYSLWNEKEIKDYDIFCKNKAAVSRLKQHFKLHKEKADIITKNAITMGKFQFIIKHVGDPDVEVRKFDFKHNCYYYDNSGFHSLYGWDYINSNKLEFNSERARDVLNIITRIPKFLERGMEISQKEILDILEMGTRPTKYISERRGIKQRKRGKVRY